jgi:hypothetical protein
MKSIDAKQIDTLSGDSYWFDNICVWIYRDNNDRYRLNVWHPKLTTSLNDFGKLVVTPNKIASFSFLEKDEVLNMTTNVLNKITLADALFGWINAA